ncbi:MAG: PINc/VapC family ATPase [Nitrososphaerales archaeon]
MDIIVPDTSVIIQGKLYEMIKEGKLKDFKIVIPIAVLDELQAQASKHRVEGFIGLRELKSLREECDKRGIEIAYEGERPSLEDIKLARSGRIDALIRDVAKKKKGILVTSDFVQALVAEAEGVKTLYSEREVKKEGLSFEKYFTENTLSLHFKEGVKPMAKRGKPGKFELVTLREEPCSVDELENIIKEIMDAVRVRRDGFVELSREGASVLQLGPYRIAIARPPFSDGLELTIIKPIIKLTLEDYHFSEKLMERLKKGAEGILIAGPPGSGKSTLASSMAEFYRNLGKVVKTLESPRDLQVKEEITQYSPLEGDFEKTADILLLVRPDYTVFDEIRKTKDFKVFADLRLAGVGMIGVVHSSNPIDAIQRFIGRVELGMIPHIIDTVIFIAEGEVKKIYELKLVVKVPTGMVEADLARPVVEVRDFESKNLEYEIYSFGEENVIVPISGKEEKDTIKRLAEQRLKDILSNYDPNLEVDIVNEKLAVVRVEPKVIPRIIGREGRIIREIEGKLGLNLRIEPRAYRGKSLEFWYDEKGRDIVLGFEPSLKGQRVNIFVDGKFLLSAKVSKGGKVKLSKTSEEGKELLQALLEKKEVEITL